MADAGYKNLIKEGSITKNQTMIELAVTELKTIKDKSIGLIGSKDAYSVLFKTRFGIHTFGMSYPIDVLILNRTNEVMKLTKSLEPNNIFLWNPTFDTVLELPAGEITKKNIKVGDRIKLKTVEK